MPMHKNRIILNNQTELGYEEVMDYVRKVISAGKVSDNGNNYCYLSSFKDGIMVSSDVIKTGHRFTIWRQNEK